MSTSPEINKVLYPGEPNAPQFDTIANWPATTRVTQTTGEDITRNRDALLVLERLLGPNPHIGLFSKDFARATVSERLWLLETGIAEGQYQFKQLTVQGLFSAERDINNVPYLTLGFPRNSTSVATFVNIKGLAHFFDSGSVDPRVWFDVGFKVLKPESSNQSTECTIEGVALPDKPLLTIRDYSATKANDPARLALRVLGNVEIVGTLTADYSISHATLLDVFTDPVVDSNGNVIRAANHVSRGNYHSHYKGLYDATIGRWLVDPNPTDDTYGLVRHVDLEPVTIRTTNKATGFSPQADIAYHVSNGDDHDHVGGDGAPLRHSNFLEIDPATTNHVTGGDFHSHDLAKGNGGPIYLAGIFLDKSSVYTTLDVTGAATGGQEVGSGVVSNRPDAPTTPSLANLMLQVDMRLTADASDIASLASQIGDIDTKATAARDLANSASIAASAALTTAIAAETTAQTANNSAATALTLAQNAQTTANQALTTAAATGPLAIAAAADAANAQNLANNANLAAQQALSTVNAATRPTIITVAITTAISRPSSYAFVVCTAAGITITAWLGEEGDRIVVKDGTGTAGGSPITINTTGGDLIDNAGSTSVASNYGATELVFAAGQWRKAYGQDF